jgi:4-hydroxy-tetrahydrodipicolinate synthase
MTKEFHGCWPTMITPFTGGNRVDFGAVERLTEWFVEKGADGIFAVCQSSEMFFLNEQEKIDLAVAVKNAAAGRVKVIASGHTQDDIGAQVEGLGRMAETGVDAVVMVSNRLAGKDEGEDEFRKNFEEIKRQLPDVTFGMYECPYPYLRLLTTDFLRDCAENGKLVFLKDVCCSQKILVERIAAIAGTRLSIFDASTATLLDFLTAGGDGYNGVMGNFHIDLYKWLYTHHRAEPGIARRLADFLTLAAMCEARAYPMSAKYHCARAGIPMAEHCRSKDESLFNENARLEIDSLIRMEEAWRERLGLQGQEKGENR